MKLFKVFVFYKFKHKIFINKKLYYQNECKNLDYFLIEFWNLILDNLMHIKGWEKLIR